jgi:thiol:disulfide interchange protein
MQKPVAQSGERKRPRLTRRSFLAGGLAVPAILRPSPVLTASAEMARDIASYHRVLAALAGHYRFALIDIRADWCDVCRRIEREVLSHPSVQRHLEQVPLVKVDVTAMDDGNRRLLAHLRASGPPTFFVAETASGQEYHETRSLGSFSRRNLIRRLEPFSQR